MRTTEGSGGATSIRSACLVMLVLLAGPVVAQVGLDGTPPLAPVTDVEALHGR